MSRDVILAAAEIIRLYPRSALKAPEQRVDIIQPVTESRRGDIDAIVEMLSGLDFVAGIEPFNWLDESGTVPQMLPGFKVQCKSAVEMGLWP